MHQDIGAILKKLFKRKSGSKMRKPLFGSEPEEDWKKLLIGFAILNLLIILWSGYLFWQIQEGGIFSVENSGNKDNNVNTEAKLNQTLDTYRGKEKKFEELRAAEPVVQDPVF